MIAAEMLLARGPGRPSFEEASRAMDEVKAEADRQILVMTVEQALLAQKVVREAGWRRKDGHDRRPRR